MDEIRSKRTTGDVDRRLFLKTTVASAAVSGSLAGAAPREESSAIVVDDFDRPDSLYHGDGWETLNPGYWKIAGGALRRRLHNVGDRARRTGFPYHYETHQGTVMPIAYDPSLPFGMIWRRDWRLAGNYTIRVDATVLALRSEPRNGDDPAWKQYQSGYALFGIAFGGNCLFESFDGGAKPGDAAWMAIWRDDGRFGIYDHATDAPRPAEPTAAATQRKKQRAAADTDTKTASNAETTAPALAPGVKVTIELAVSGDPSRPADVTARLIVGDAVTTVKLTGVDRTMFTDGYFGLVARGLVDFEVNRVSLEPGANRPLVAPINDLHVAYPLGDTLEQVDGRWRCRFVAMFRGDGAEATVRVADSPQPADGWENVPVAGRAPILNNRFRRNTALIDVTLPASPADATLYYTVWKDGRDVTADPRLGTDAVGVGTGMVGQVPSDGQYVGRLPRLAAPYRLCGLSCHAVHSGGPNLPESGKFRGFYVHDQPTPDAYRHLEDYDFQVMLWEDDVWYMELMIYPPSTDDAYKIVTTTIAGPTSRWQMMRHWNIVNPGDHDHGMDDVKGPEQIVIRNNSDLGQDPDYMQRNFQIVSHLTRGWDDPSPTDNPKRWRHWKMPDGDFTLLVMDSRLWRSSQDTRIWDDEGWGHKKNLYDRHDPTRSLLGEEQFAWLQQFIRTDSSPIICLTGINGLHTIWTGFKFDDDTGLKFNQRDRVAADYAGWVSAGCDRVIELLSGRDGVVSVYGDVHNGSIARNVAHRLIECSFGPIGRTGGRSPKEEFGPRMKDYDGRDLEIFALYHKDFASAKLDANDGPTYWNFLEMHFDPRGAEPTLRMQIRNLIDAPRQAPRGGGGLEERVAATGREIGCSLPPIKTLPNADVLFTTVDGQPIRGARSLIDGAVPVRGLVDVAPAARIVMTAIAGDQVDAQLLVTRPV